MIDLASLSPEEILAFLLENYDKKEAIRPFFGDEIFRWIHSRWEYDTSRYSNIPKRLRDFLSNETFLPKISAKYRLISRDRSEKLGVELKDGEIVETVYIPFRNRATVCVSSQVGCRFGCSFCQTAKMGFRRSLSPSEIVSQVYLFLKEGKRVTHVVFMGMGEPLDNYENVIKAVKILNNPLGLGISIRRITLSTVGLLPGIKRLINEGMQINLALSLHDPIPEERQRLVPAEGRHPIKKLLPLLMEYYRRTSRQVTFEYVVIEGINDTPRHSRRLTRIVEGLDYKLNLIPLNIPGMDRKTWHRNKAVVLQFKEMCLNAGLKNVTIRLSRGVDISGACGLLAGRNRRDSNQRR